jgi:predicted 2-oxoglutarate/Fe(II)-dependent dioxygenase YbiX
MDIVRKDISLSEIYGENHNLLAFTLDNVLNAAECEDLLKATVFRGRFRGGGRNFDRNNQRCIIDSKERAGFIWERIKNYIPETWKSHPVVGLNERLRFLKYSPGEYFAPHFDGSYERPDGKEISFITIQLYLNEGFKGGNTTFMSSKDGTSKNLGVVPKIGRILVFQHDILHEGSMLLRGTKYTMRTDVMYAVPQQAEVSEMITSSQPYLPPGVSDEKQSAAPDNLSKSALKNKKRREAAKNKAKAETETNGAASVPETNNSQGAKGILSDPDKEKKIRKLNEKIQSIQKIKQAHSEGKPLEKNQIEKLSKEQELLDELEALKLS